MCLGERNQPPTRRATTPTATNASATYCRQRARSVGRLAAVTLSTRRRDFRSSPRLLRSAMAYQWAWERPCAVSCAREWWYSVSGAAARSSTRVYIVVPLFLFFYLWSNLHVEKPSRPGCPAVICLVFSRKIFSVKTASSTFGKGQNNTSI